MTFTPGRKNDSIYLQYHSYWHWEGVISLPEWGRTGRDAGAKLLRAGLALFAIKKDGIKDTTIFGKDDLICEFWETFNTGLTEEVCFMSTGWSERPQELLRTCHCPDSEEKGSFQQTEVSFCWFWLFLVKDFSHQK